MLLGAHVFPKTNDPEELTSLLAQKGYRAGYCPKDLSSRESDRIRSIRSAFEARGIVIAEVGAWCNPMCGANADRKRAEDYIIDRLAVAEELGARCCVNVVGTLGEHDSSVPGNYEQPFFEQVVELARRVIDAVNPRHTKMAFEITPFTFLDGAEGYERLIRAIDRPGAAVHLDPINCIFTPRAYHLNGTILEDVVRRLVPLNIASVHLKDLYLAPARANVCIDEVPIGTGGIDYRRLLTALNGLPMDTPVMLEHLKDDAEYDQAAAAVRRTATELGIDL